MKAVILAAGKGTRLGPLTKNRPKPLIPLAGKPVIEHIIKSLIENNVKDIAIVVHYYKDKIIKYVEGLHLNANINYIYQEELSGTGSALLVSEEFIKDEPFITIYGDVTLNRKILVNIIKYFEENPCDTLMVGVRVNDPSKYGVLILDKDRLMKIIEKPKRDVGSNLINAGIYVFTPKIFDACRKIRLSERGELELTDAIMFLGKHGIVRVFDGGKNWWYDVGHPWDLLDANKYYLSLIKTDIVGKCSPNTLIYEPVVISKGSHIESGVVIFGPSYIGKNVEIGYNSVIGPYASICDGVKIGPLSFISGSIILNNTIISSHCSVFESVIGEKCYIESGVSIPSINIYGENIKVLIKNVEVDSGRKKLGALIGDNVTIGANTSIWPGIVIMPNKRIDPNTFINKPVI